MYRRGGAGIAAFDRHTQSTQSYSELSSSLTATQIASLQSQLATFRASLSRFSSSHRSDIRRDPEFRRAFQKMCAAIGVDPLAGPRKGSWWAELLGLGDWQYELGVQIVGICVSTRERNGGIIEMRELLRLITKLRGLSGIDGAITEEDIARSIKIMETLGAGYEIFQVGNKKMVRSVVKELDVDQALVLEIAQDTRGRVDEKEVCSKTGWPVERVRVALDNMVFRDGLCWVDEDEQSGVVYWVPAVMIWDD